MYKYHSYEDYGLLLDEDTVKFIAEKLCNGFTEEDWEDNKEHFLIILSDNPISYVTDFSGDAARIDDQGKDLWIDYENFNCENVCYIAVLKYPHLFGDAAYKSVEELIAEFKIRVGEYLPADFDYRNSLRHIVGVRCDY